MASLKLGEGYVELFVDDRRYHPAMARAERALDALAARWRGAFSGRTAGFAAAIGRLDDFRDAAHRAERAVRDLVRAINAANTAMAGGSGAGLGSIMRAMGAARATVVRGYGTAISSVIRGAGSAASAVIGSLGRATAANVRAAGSSASAALRAAAGILRAAVSPLNAAIRGVSSVGRGALAGASRILRPTALLGGLGAGLSAGMFARTARDESIEIESRLVNLGRIADLSGKQLDTLGGRLKELARTMPGVKLSDVFDISTIAAKMGVGADILPNFTRDLAKMSTVLEDMPIEVATERIGRLITVFEKGPQDAIRFASALNALDIASTASADDILNITTRFAGMAKAFNATPAQAMAWATAIRQAGVPLETSGTATQQIISRLASRKDMGRFSRIAGMDRDQFRGLLDTNPIRAMQEVLRGLKRVRDTAGPSGLSQTMDKLHLDGQRVRGAFLQMIPVVDELNKYLQIAEGDWESLDSVERGYAAKSKTTRAQLELLANNFKLFAASIGDRLMPVVRRLADGLTFLFQDIEKYFNGDGGAVVEAWADRVGDALHKVAVLWREWPTFLELGKITVQEKVGQVQEIFKRLPTFLGNVMRMTGNFLGDLAFQIGRTVGQSILKGLLQSIGKAPVEITTLLGAINPALGTALGAASTAADSIQIDPVRPNLGLFSREGLYQDENGRANLPNGLFGALPDRGLDIMAQTQKLTNAEARLAEERRKAAEAAEAEAAALRKKPELTGPPREGAGPRRPVTLSDRDRAHRTARGMVDAWRAQVNAAFGLGHHRPKRTRLSRLGIEVPMTGPPDLEGKAWWGRKKRLDRLPPAVRKSILDRGTVDWSRNVDAREVIDARKAAESGRSKEARATIRAAQDRERSRQEEAQKQIDARKKAEGAPASAAVDLKKSVDKFLAAVETLQRNGIPLALNG